MIPETFPILVSDDIIPPPAEEYKEGDRKSTVGWLKYLYLFAEDDEYLVITAKDRKAIKGNKISFKTHEPLTKKEAWNLFLTFLDISGFAAVQQANPSMYRIIF